MVNINHSTITNIENEKTNLSDHYIKIFAEFIKVSSDYLLGIENLEQFNESSNKPIYSKNDIAQKENTTLDEAYFQSYLMVPEITDVSDCIGLKAADDSMKSLGIMGGDFLHISTKQLIENNSIVAIAIDSGTAAVRKHVILENKELLISDVGIEVMSKDHFIIGKVIGFSRVFK